MCAVLDGNGRMRDMLTSRCFPRAALVLCALLVPSAIAAQSGTTTESGATTTGNGSATLTVEQTGPQEGVAGEWSLLKPDFKRVEMGQKIAHTFPSAAAGNYTIIATSPDGASTSIKLWVNEQLIKIVELPQISFSLTDGDVARVSITHVYTHTGKMSVTTEPQGMTFTIKGPNSLVFTGTSPMEFADVPIGQYTIYFDPIEDCISPRPKSDKLLNGSRIQFSMTIACENLDRLPQARAEENALEFITVTVGNEQITFDDIRTEEWYATSVYTAIRTGIMSGYKDPDGKLTGKFGPGDSVTLAQLAKVAHRLAGIDEMDERTLPVNERARGTWFADVYASAERRGWLAYRSIRENPERPATRSEVVCTLLHALSIPRIWPTGERFSDVSALTPYADCIETAAEDKLITGDAAGTFGPERPINRAELSKMLTTAMDIYGEKTAEIRGNYDGMK